jgi:hypothetical protein
MTDAVIAMPVVAGLDITVPEVVMSVIAMPGVKQRMVIQGISIPSFRSLTDGRRQS